MSDSKLKIGIITNNILARTGLGRNAKCWTPLLFKSGKYDIHFLNQGANDNDPSFQKLPYKNFGVFKNFDQNRFNSDPNYQRIVAYSNTAVEEFVVSNKLQVVIALDDPWAFLPEFFFKTDWYQHMKNNFLIDLTIDSEPVLPLIKEWAQNCPNTHFWSGFGKRVLEREDYEKYKHIRILRGAVDGTEFKPLSQDERLKLRRQFGIADDEKIIIYVFRNQLRKLAHSNMEALVEFKKKHPTKKIRLLFHTKFSEPAGWPLAQIREELKLNQEDILSSYNCRSCLNWLVKPYQGEDLDCPYCNGQKTMVSPGVDSVMNEHELNKVYNLADACSSPFTSGGQENNCVESMLCELPLACPNYSSGEDFILSGYVHEIKGTFTRECSTSFKKFVPDIYSIVEFYEKIFNIKESDKKELTKKARKWAIEQFSPETIAKQLEAFIDSCQPIDWDSFLKKKQELKNINAQIEDKQNDDDFVMECYSKILNMTPPPEDEGRKHWNNFLKQPKDKVALKNEMVACMRQAGYVHNQKVKPNSFEDLLDKNDKSRVLVYLPQSLGDLYILTSLLPEIQKKYPDSSIYVGCDPKYHEVFDGNEFVKKCLPLIPEMGNEMLMVGFADKKGLFNNYINVGLSTQQALNYLSNKYE